MQTSAFTRSRGLCLILLVAPAFCAAVASAEANAAFSGDVVALVRRAAANEIAANENRDGQGPNPVRFKIRKKDEKGVTTKEIIQTKDGSVARLIAINDRPLSPEQDQAERARLERLMAQPELQAHRRRREKEDSDRADKLIRIMPEAFLYTYEGMAQAVSGPAIKLRFRPKPGFVAPDQESRIVAGMEGELLIDKAQERMVRFDAHFIEDVDFGWGIVGRLYKGGSVHIENADIGGHNWQFVNMTLDLTGKAFMIKLLTLRIAENATDFRLVEKSIGYQEGIRILESEAAPIGPTAGR